MKEQFVTYEIASKLKYLGFDEDCLGWWYTWGKEPEIDFGFTTRDQLVGSAVLAPIWQQVIDWFDEKYNFDIVVLKEFLYKSNINYYWYYITSPKKNCYSDITDWQNRFGDLLDECSQDIEGNYLDNEKFNKLIFERGFAFNAKQEAREQAILKAIELIKK